MCCCLLHWSHGQEPQALTGGATPSPPLQVRADDTVHWKKLTVQDAYTACLSTDALVAAVTAVARGTTTEEVAAAELAAFQAPQVSSRAALVIPLRSHCHVMLRGRSCHAAQHS